ncbi:winged helix-turn-helix transcriptional regulator [Natronococcus amylolyticus]|uniref:winged helix-turn-helix transcriptional regulator n=1 Tax=Natronococcus amylolyticus TaxID=44470 RepID=UPI001360B330|nr:winged helix-turn-helix transcriptional regulator [Natronococcus amylolyticus]
MSGDVRGFLWKKGSIRMVCEMGYNGSRFNELDDALDISQGTLTKRLKRAEYLSLVDTEVVDGEKGKSHAYILTNRGRYLLMNMEHIGLVHYHYELRDARKGFDDARDNVLDTIVDGYEEMDKEYADDEFIPIAPTLYTTTDPAKEEQGRVDKDE